MDDQLMLGILLIIVGVAFALIAAALVLNRREARIAEELGIDDAGESPVDSAKEDDSEERDHGPADEQDEPEGGDEQEEPSDEPADEQDEPEADDEQDEDEAEQIEEPGRARERQLVAEIYREEVTGALIVRAGDHEYRAANEISDESERRRLAYAATDLSGWFEDSAELSRRKAPSSSTRQSPDRMLEEIDSILQRKLAAAEQGDRGVRLIPDASGGVRVLIGVKSYEIDDVPDKAVKEFIREAVAEWEAG